MKKEMLLLNKMSSPRNVVGDLRLMSCCIIKRLFACFIKTKSAEDFRQKHSAMTLIYGRRAFTLIELLVVVLIIGILSAIALPQYQKAVWKSKATQLQVMVKSLAEAQTAYALANGSYAADFSSLDIGFDTMPLHPSSSSTAVTSASSDAVRANDETEVVINGEPASWLFSIALFKTGPYAKAGFGYVHVPVSGLYANKWYCQEQESITEGKFCVKVMGLKSTPIHTLNYRYYSLD